MEPDIRVVVADDHPLFRMGIIHTLASEPGIEVVGQAASAQEAVSSAAELRPDLIVLDMNMPGGGLLAVAGIVAGSPEVRSLMLTVVADEDQVRAAIQMGARGYVQKGASGSELVRAVRVITGGDTYISPELIANLIFNTQKPGMRKSDRKDPFSDLTWREEQILDVLALGHSNREIGEKLALSERTVKHYLTGILQKLNVRNRVEAALLATERRRRIFDARIPA